MGVARHVGHKPRLESENSLTIVELVDFTVYFSCAVLASLLFAMHSVSRKRKRAAVTLATKIKIVHELETGKSQRIVSDLFKVPKSTIADIWKHRQKIQDAVSSSESLVYAKKRCIVREPKFDLVDDACWENSLTIVEQHAKGAPVSVDTKFSTFR